MSQKIVVTLKGGKPTIATSGFEGTSCLDATAALENLLVGEGGVEVRDTRFDEVAEEQVEYN